MPGTTRGQGNPALHKHSSSILAALSFGFQQVLLSVSSSVSRYIASRVANENVGPDEHLWVRVLDINGDWITWNARPTSTIQVFRSLVKLLQPVFPPNNLHIALALLHITTSPSHIARICRSCNCVAMRTYAQAVLAICMHQDAASST